MKHFNPREFAGDLIEHLPGHIQLDPEPDGLTITLSDKTVIKVQPDSITIGECEPILGKTAPVRALYVLRRRGARLDR